MNDNIWIRFMDGSSILPSSTNLLTNMLKIDAKSKWFDSPAWLASMMNGMLHVKSFNNFFRELGVNAVCTRLWKSRGWGFDSLGSHHFCTVNLVAKMSGLHPDYREFKSLTVHHLYIASWCNGNMKLSESFLSSSNLDEATIYACKQS